jgi:hypothetical protein
MGFCRRAASPAPRRPRQPCRPAPDLWERGSGRRGRGRRMTPGAASATAAAAAAATAAAAAGAWRCGEVPTPGRAVGAPVGPPVAHPHGPARPCPAVRLLARTQVPGGAGARVGSPKIWCWRVNRRLWASLGKTGAQSSQQGVSWGRWGMGRCAKRRGNQRERRAGAGTKGGCRHNSRVAHTGLPMIQAAGID